MFSGRNNSPAFVRVLAVFEAWGVFGWAFPLRAATGAGGFVFIAPYFEVCAANVAFNVCWCWLQELF